MLNNKIIKICEQKLIFLNYSIYTNSIYLHYIKEFVNNVNKQIVHLNSTDFQNYIDNYKFTSISQQNQIISAIKFLYEKVLNKKYNKIDFTRPRNEKHLPQIIEQNKLKHVISKIENLKHKTIISLAYSVGLRVSEVINLKIEDIDSKRMIIYINNAKGRKDRIVPLSQNILELLRIYFKEYKPLKYLFNGQNSLQYSTNSCNQIVKKYIGEKYHFHLLRHSCFTHLIENGTDCRIIQKIAGHSSIKTTEGYMQVSTDCFKNIKLPI
jgi:site-specific recombinase XerD